MVKALVQHIDEAHFRYGGPRKVGEPRQERWRWIGDFKEGPWLSVIEREAGRHVEPHSHEQDEIVLIMEGGFTLEGDERFCGPGTILSFPRTIKYGFTVGDDGEMVDGPLWHPLG